MRVHTKIVTDMASGAVVEDRFYHYDGPVAECKRGQAKSEADQQMQAYQQQALQNLAFQKSLINPEVPALQNMFMNPTGYSPEELAAMRSQAISSSGDATRTALQSLKSQLSARGLIGGATPTGGTAGRSFGQFYDQSANNLANTMAGISISNAQQALQNKWNALSSLGSFASIFNPSPFVQGSGEALGSRAQLETAPTAWQAAIPRTNIGLNWGGKPH